MNPQPRIKTHGPILRAFSACIRRHPDTLALLFGCTIVLLALALAETALRLKAAAHTAPDDPLRVLAFGAYTRPDPRLGFRGLPQAACTDFARRGPDTLFEKPMTLNAEGWRNAPAADNRPHTRIALFFGCSFTFGTGASDRETLPARFAAHAPCYQPRNFAMPAYGPQQMWLLLHDPAFIAALPDLPGIAVYLYLGHHRNRLIGAPDVIAAWPYNLPRLVLRNGTIALEGWHVVEARRDYRPWEHLHLYRWIQNRRPHPPIPDYTHDSDALLTRLLLECAQTLAAQRPALRFLVIPFPMQSQPPLPPALNRVPNLTILNFDDGTFNPYAGDAGFYRDGRAQPHGHPKPALLDAIAERLAREAAQLDARLACAPQ